MKQFPRQLLIIMTALSVFGPIQALAISARDRHAVNYDTTYYEELPTCTTGVGSDELAGHRLPATKGGVGLEEYFRNDNVYALVPPPINKKEEDYYITMRWRYRKWAWDGNSIEGTEDIEFYQNHPRVLVTNPATGKSIIAAAIEAGPAPWTGTAEGKDNPPAYWQDYVDGTPNEYLGRVAGLPPKAFEALGAKQRMYGEVNNDDLLFAWAPDQRAEPGPTNVVLAADPTNPACTGGLGVSPDGFVFPLKTSKQSIKTNQPAWCWNNPNGLACHGQYPAADIFEDPGTKVVVARNGTVVSAYNRLCGGNQGESSSAFIRGEDGNYYLYMHMAQGSVVVRAGQKVAAGQEVGEVGPAECAEGTSPHLHFDIRTRPDIIIYRECILNGTCTGNLKYMINPQPPLIAAFKNLPER